MRSFWHIETPGESLFHRRDWLPWYMMTPPNTLFVVKGNQHILVIRDSPSEINHCNGELEHFECPNAHVYNILWFFIRSHFSLDKYRPHSPFSNFKYYESFLVKSQDVKLRYFICTLLPTGISSFESTINNFTSHNVKTYLALNITTFSSISNSWHFFTLTISQVNGDSSKLLQMSGGPRRVGVNEKWKIFKRLIKGWRVE